MKQPLAFRMRPTSIDEVIGQEHLVGKNGFLRNCLESDVALSMILYGPSGCGKTTIAEAFAKSMNINFIKLNAVTSNKDEMMQAIKEAKLIPSIIMVDEVHRLNKDKQDLFLPYLEAGTFIFIGATTSNPILAINKAIRSRTRLLEVLPLKPQEILIGLKKALVSPNGLNNSRSFSDEALNYISKIAGGDLRYGYNILESASLSYTKNHLITEEDINSLNFSSNTLMDKDEDEHYDTVSALQKSIRGSDVDAAILYLGKMLSSGDLEGTIRRLLITAYEDIGLANPPAVDRCYNACQVALSSGLPEAMIPLGFTVVDLALSPKSKSAALAIENAYSFVKEKPIHVRSYLRYTPVDVDAEDRYPYDRPDIWENIIYMPENMEHLKFYYPERNSKYEQNITQNYDRLKNIYKTNNLKELKKYHK